MPQNQSSAMGIFQESTLPSLLLGECESDLQTGLLSYLHKIASPLIFSQELSKALIVYLLLAYLLYTLQLDFDVFFIFD